MSHRERFFTALDLKEPDMVPVTDLGLDPPIVEAITGKKLGGFSLIEVSGRKPWELSARNRITMSEACIMLDFDAVPAISDYSLCSKNYRPESISDNKFVDEWGKIFEPRADTKTTWWIGGAVKTEEDMKEYVAPDPDEEGRVELVEKILKPLKDKDVAVMGLGHSGWSMAFQIRGGIDKLLIDMFRRPKLTKEFMKKIADACFGMVKLMIEGEVDVLFITDDYAGSHGPFMNLEQFREFELPSIRRIVDFAKKRDVPVLKHSDGNIYPIIDYMVDAGISGLHPIEPGAMDLGDVKKRYGKSICLLGNVDCRHVLPSGSEENVRKDVRRCIDSAAEGGGYILTSSNSIHANCKVENIYTMVDEARKYGKYL